MADTVRGNLKGENDKGLKPFEAALQDVMDGKAPDVTNLLCQNSIGCNDLSEVDMGSSGHYGSQTMVDEIGRSGGGRRERCQPDTQESRRKRMPAKRQIQERN